MKHSHSNNNDEDDSNLMGVNSSYIHHLNEDHEDDDYTGDILANHLRQTASKGYPTGDRFSARNSRSTTGSSSNYHGRTSHSTSNTSRKSSSLEDSYTRAMNRVSRGGDYYYYDPKQQQQQDEQKEVAEHPEKLQQQRRSTISNNSRSKKSSATSRSNGSGKSHQHRHSSISTLPSVTKKPVSNKDPSEETIAIFGAYGVTGHYFLQLAMEAGYKVRALILPGMELDDVDVKGNDNLRLITGTFDEEEKVRRVVKNSSYVVCLLNDCDKTLQHSKQQRDATTCASNLENLPPTLIQCDQKETSKVAASSTAKSTNLQFMEILLPILEELDTCRVLLYQASSIAKDNKGTTPILGKFVKNLAVMKNWRQALREQDRIVKYIVNSTMQTSMNFIITRPASDCMIWDRPSRKKLSASKSQPGPFPITNTDLAEFTLGALRMDKIYNSCPYVVQDGI